MRLSSLTMPTALAARSAPRPRGVRWPSTVRTTSLRVQGAAADASVTIDDRYLGLFGYVQAAARGGQRLPGKHRVTVEKTGFFPWDHLVEVHEGDPPIKLDVTLVKIPGLTPRADTLTGESGRLSCAPLEGPAKNMANTPKWNIRMRHEWLATPLKKKRLKRCQKARVGLSSKRRPCAKKAKEKTSASESGG